MVVQRMAAKPNSAKFQNPTRLANKIFCENTCNFRKKLYICRRIYEREE